jgi:hypothetical protein
VIAVERPETEPAVPPSTPATPDAATPDATTSAVTTPDAATPDAGLGTAVPSSRRRGSLLDRWYLILIAAVLIAAFPVVTALLSDAGTSAGPPDPPVAASAPAGIAATGEPSASPRSSSRPPASRRPTPSGTPRPPTAGRPSASRPTGNQPTASRTVAATTPLFRGASISTARTTLRMDTTGDLVITDAAGVQLWHAGTGPRGFQATFQDDGNFAVYTLDFRPLWSSGTAGHPGAVLVLQGNGDVCIVERGTSLWCAGTAH